MTNKKTKGKSSENWKGAPLKRTLTKNDGYRYPKTIQKFKRDRGLHPTQKPVALAEFLIKSFTDPNDVVLDYCMGSGTNGVAAITNERNFIGVEKEKQSLNLMCRGAALRYLLTRIYDFFNTPNNALIKIKDPREYLQKLIIHNNLMDYKDYYK